MATLQIWLLLLIIEILNLNPTSSVDIVDHPHHFCYDQSSCGPTNNELWPGACQSGESQSPIDLVDGPTEEEVEVPLHHLKTDHFFMQNNGHTINLDFANENELGDSYFFPGYGLNDRLYRLSNVHFHWGTKDGEGSEHTVDGKAYGMEMHFVHYNAEYLNPAQAIGSGDKNALAVVGVFLEVDKSADPHPSLAPIVKNLNNIKEVHSYWIKVEEDLDLTPLMPKAGAKVFSYQGSLTTPGCNEQVNWFVFKDPVSISSSDVKAFRSVVDGEMKPIKVNRRPTQKVFKRKIKIRKSTGGGHVETTTDSSAGGAPSLRKTRNRSKKKN